MSNTTSNLHNFLPLTPISFHILLALRDHSQHGYGILKEIRQISNGELSLSAGTLYNAINRLLRARLIMVVSKSSDENSSPKNKKKETGVPSVTILNGDNQTGQTRADKPQLTRYYHITGLGQRTLEAELKRLDELARTARQKPAFEGLSAILGDAG